MGFGSCDCPLPTALEDISDVTCQEHIGQIHKIIFQRRQATPSFTALTGAGSPVLLASWTPLLAAVNDTKVTVTPVVENVIIPVVEAILEGGDDNTTPDGAPITVGATTPRATGNFRGLPAAILKELKSYNCREDLTVYFINEFGKIIGLSEDGSTFTGIPVSSFFIGDGGNEGKNTHDKTMFGFSLQYGWRDNLKFATPTDFNARTAL